LNHGELQTGGVLSVPILNFGRFGIRSRLKKRILVENQGRVEFGAKNFFEIVYSVESMLLI